MITHHTYWRLCKQGLGVSVCFLESMLLLSPVMAARFLADTCVLIGGQACQTKSGWPTQQCAAAVA
jgi:hypothetical protein